MRHRLKVFGLVLLVATLSLAQTPTSSSVQNPPGSSQDQRLAAVPLVGRLEVHRGRTARVDNADLEEGSTILDGQTIETSDCTSATVHLLPVGMIAPTIVEVGQIDIASNTKVLINYSAGNIKATIERGCARVRSVRAINSSISTLDGKLLQAVRDSLNRQMVEVCYPSDKRESFDPVCVPPIVWVVGGGGGAAAITAVAVGTRGDDPSPELPSP